MLYSRPQLRLLIVAAALLLAGLAVREWRAGFPELAERLETFDREEPVVAAAPPLPAPRDEGPPPPARPSPAAAATGERAGTRTSDPRPLDLNRAGEEQIARLPGVGAALARRIVEERQRRGRFDSPEALRGVLGLGPKKLTALRDLITVGD